MTPELKPFAYAWRWKGGVTWRLTFEEKPNPHPDIEIKELFDQPAADDLREEPEAVRHSFDGYGWHYTDAGNGSFWLKRAMELPDAEPLYARRAAPTADDLRAVARDVLAERERQIAAEGWDDVHDDMNDRSELAQAAACYALSGTPADEAVFIHGRWKDPRDLFWPYSWDRSWWKPTDRRRDLVKAGALILAEIERLDRAALRDAQGGSSHD